VLALRADDEHALATLAHLLAAEGRSAEALALQARLTALAPQSAAAWFNLGYLHERLEQVREAEDAFRRALEVNPRLDLAWYGLGRALSAQDRMAEAADAFRENTRLQPLSPHGWEALARTLWRQGLAASAHETVRHLRGFEPKVARRLAAELGLAESP
jgi:tetratricopeptide (TPR) repeat protein